MRFGNVVMEDQYSVLIRLANQLTADGFYCSYNRKRFKPTEVGSFQVARTILEDPQDSTKVHLIYANVTKKDILLKVVELVILLSDTNEVEFENGSPERSITNEAEFENGASLLSNHEKEVDSKNSSSTSKAESRNDTSPMYNYTMELILGRGQAWMKLNPRMIQ